VPYQDEYLAGFVAERYQVSVGRGFSIAQKTMDVGIRSAVRRDIGGDEQRISSVNTRHDHVTFKHLLMPVWSCAYRYNKKVFRFLVNARTGEIQGQRPWSYWKIFAAILIALAAVIGIFLLISGGVAANQASHNRHYNDSPYQSPDVYEEFDHEHWPADIQHGEPMVPGRPLNMRLDNRLDRQVHPDGTIREDQ